MYYLLIGGHGEGEIGELPEDFDGFIQEEKHEYSSEDGWNPKVELADKYVPMSLPPDLISHVRIFRHESLNEKDAWTEVLTGYQQWMSKKHNRLF